MAAKQDQEQQPNPSDMQKGADVASAGVTAAQNEPDPEKRPRAAANAIQEAAQAQGWELTDDDCKRIANFVIQGIEDRGGFDAPPEPVAVPPAPTGEGSLPEQPAHAVDPPPAPEHRSFAERFRSK